MKRILVAYDGGEPAAKALMTTVELAKLTGATVSVVSVVPFHPGLGNFTDCENFTVDYGEEYSIQLVAAKAGLDKQLLEAFAGFEYDSCCFAARMLVRHYVNVVGASTADTALYFEVEFKGIGSTGTRTQNYLRRTMLGYE